MKRDELIINLSLGVSVIFWGLIGIQEAFFGNYSTVRLFSAALNLFLGFFLVFRKPVLKSGSWRSILISLPSFLLGGLLFKLAHPFQNWPLSFEIVFVVGVISAILSFAYLGRNFAIFPSLRSISKGGPYRLVRHPGYASEIMMTVACCLAKPTLVSAITLFTFIVFLYFRIEEEEKLLSESEEYLQYKLIVRWKLLPFFW